VRRWEFVLGKFAGLVGTLALNTFFMALGVFAALLYLKRTLAPEDGWVLIALYFIVLQFVIVTSLALLFSTFSSPLLSAVFAFSLFIIGSFAEDLRWLATFAAWLVPNLGSLNVISTVAHARAVPGDLILFNTVYALAYAAAALFAAILIFEHRNLK
jgi:ABC-type transport system involved in multi-copper enzyme maturation permease subunit